MWEWSAYESNYDSYFSYIIPLVSKLWGLLSVIGISCHQSNQTCNCHFLDTACECYLSLGPLVPRALRIYPTMSRRSKSAPTSAIILALCFFLESSCLHVSAKIFLDMQCLCKRRSHRPQPTTAENNVDEEDLTNARPEA